MRRVHGLLVAIALTACGAGPEKQVAPSVAVLGPTASELSEATQPSARFAAPIARLRGPTRPLTIAILDLDVDELPTLDPVALDALPAEVRQGAAFALRMDGTFEFSGLEGLDVEVGKGRWLAHRGRRAAGAGSFDGIGATEVATWRGHMARGDAGRLRFLCFEGSFDGVHAKIASAYEVLAEPMVPGVLWAFRSGRADVPAPVLGATGERRLSPEPCVGAERIEFVGPPPVWTIGSSADPRDSVGFGCSRGVCPFSRVALPILPGEVSSGLIVSDDPDQRGMFDGVPEASNIFSYAFELDGSGDGKPVGHVFVGAGQAAASSISPGFTR